jgi:cell division protein FtsQ
MSRQGRRRVVLAGVKLAIWCVVGVGCVLAALVAYETWENDPVRLKEPVKSVPLRQVVFSTDGVLDRAWLDQTLALPKNASLMALDLTGLEKRLLSSGQAQSVVLRRRFNDSALVVAVQERTPVARVMVQSGDSPPEMRLVARDGVVYEGTGYERSLVDRLPWVGGVALRRTAGGGLEPIAGMDRVDDLLRAARGLSPGLYAGWEVVSLARLASDNEIVVRTREIPEVIFDAAGGYPRQLAKLDFIVDSLRNHGNPPVARVDFSVGSQVPVALQDARPGKPGGSAFTQSASPTTKRRDF